MTNWQKCLIVIFLITCVVVEGGERVRNSKRITELENGKIILELENKEIAKSEVERIFKLKEDIKTLLRHVNNKFSKIKSHTHYYNGPPRP